MGESMNRRNFFKTSASLGLSAAMTSSLFSCRGGASAIDISVVKGEDYHKAALKAVDLLGGMSGFVPKGAKVALLPNAQRWNPGTYTKPEIVRAVIEMCLEAGAEEVNVLSWLGMQNWERTGLAEVIQSVGGSLKLIEREETAFKTVTLARGRAMTDAMIIGDFYNHDVFINMPITKDHAGNKFTGTLKNLMGLNFPTHNRSNFHRPNWKTDPNDIAHLDQCIADLNLAVKPTLNIVDATEFIITNGPMGPGEVITPHKVIAGTDRVAVDTCCTSLWGLDSAEIVAINRAAAHGLGVMDLTGITIKEVGA